MTAKIAAPENHGARWSDKFIKMVEDRGAFDQCLAVVEHKRRHTM